MESKQILEGNRLIGQFMGYTMFDKKFPRNHGIGAPENEYKDMIVEKAKYHCFWGWLMPVVEKISRIEFERRYDEYLEKWVIWTHHPVTFGMLDELGRPMVRFYCNTLHIADTLIQATWNAVVDFIKWYNEQSLSLTQLNKDK